MYLIQVGPKRRHTNDGGCTGIKEFVVLSERAQKMEEIWNDKKRAKDKSEDTRKCSMAKIFLTTLSKRIRDFKIRLLLMYEI